MKIRRLAGNRRSYFSLTVFLFRCLIYLEFINGFFFPVEIRNWVLLFIYFILKPSAVLGLCSSMQPSLAVVCGLSLPTAWGKSVFPTRDSTCVPCIGREILFFFKFYLFWAVLGLHSCTQARSSCGEQGLLSGCGGGLSLQ